MAQDFWASSGYRRLGRAASGELTVTDDWLSGILEREELRPPEDAGPVERHLHARLIARPRLRVEGAELAALEDPDAQENWTRFLEFRDRLAAHPTVEACYRDLFRGPEAGIAPAFADLLAQVIARSILEGSDDPWRCRAAELAFRRQRVSTEGGRVLCADATTIAAYAETGGFGNVGRLLRSQNTALTTPKMDVLSHENAALYFLRDELFGFLLDLTPGSEGSQALAAVLERWVAHLLGIEVTITPLAAIDDERWRWHVGLDVHSTTILNALYRGEAVEASDRERLATLFRLEFRDPADALAEMQGRPVYLGLAFAADRTLKMKPQNLLANLPLALRM